MLKEACIEYYYYYFFIFFANNDSSNDSKWRGANIYAEGALGPPSPHSSAPVQPPHPL